MDFLESSRRGKTEIVVIRKLLLPFNNTFKGKCLPPHPLPPANAAKAAYAANPSSPTQAEADCPDQKACAKK